MRFPDRVRSTEACERVSDLEQLLERQVVALVVRTHRGELEFVLPGNTPDETIGYLMYTIATAARNALKSL